MKDNNKRIGNKKIGIQVSTIHIIKNCTINYVIF